MDTRNREMGAAQSNPSDGLIPAIWTSYFIEMSPEEAIATFASKGWNHLEISFEHGDVLLERGSPERTGDALRRFAESHGVALAQGHLDFKANIAADDKTEVVGRLKRWLDLFAAAGVRAAVLHPGALKPPDPPREMEPRVEVLRALSDHLGDTDLTICLENMVAHSADDLLAMIRAAGCAHLGICLDTGHLNQRSKGVGQAEFIRAAGPFLKALHMAENNATADQHMMPFARGSVPWHEVIETLREVAYRGLLNLEVSGERLCPLPVKLAKLDYMSEMMGLMLRIDNGRALT